MDVALPEGLGENRWRMVRMAEYSALTGPGLSGPMVAQLVRPG